GPLLPAPGPASRAQCANRCDLRDPSTAAGCRAAGSTAATATAGGQGRIRDRIQAGKRPLRLATSASTSISAHRQPYYGLIWVPVYGQYYSNALALGAA